MSDEPKLHFDCGARDCGRSWSHHSLATIAQRVARHWNEDHGDDLEHGYEQIDTIERGGHHLHGNEYSVIRIPVYLTSFDVMERIGQEDGYAVPSDDEGMCPECLRVIDEDDRVELTDEWGGPKTGYEFLGTRDDWWCSACVRAAEIERKASENESLAAYVVGGGDE